MQLRKALVLHKKSTFQIQAVERKEARFLKLMREGNEALMRVQVAHDEHQETLELLASELERRNIESVFLARSELSEKVEGFDLVISVGGDGTFLDASHFVDDLPILGLNSSSSSSFGHYCLAKKVNLISILDQIQEGSLKPIGLLRLELLLNDAVLPDLILNEVLIAHSSPAATSRYFLWHDGKREEQRSSGLWVGTPGGSTGSLRSAGGDVLPINSDQFEYVVREACMRPNERWKLLKGQLNRGSELTVISQMRTGSIFIDGPHIDYLFGLGDKLVVRASERNLNAFISESVNEIFQKSC